jgi:hypothetical protein
VEVPLGVLGDLGSREGSGGGGGDCQKEQSERKEWFGDFHGVATASYGGLSRGTGLQGKRLHEEPHFYSDRGRSLDFGLFGKLL